MDWVTAFLELTEGLPTPAIFRLWSAISAIASAMERRVWVKALPVPTYPNMFVLLVAPPGTGKDQSISPAHKLLADSKVALLAPDDMTKAAMIDVLDNTRRRVLYNGETIVYSPLCIMVPEFGTLVSAHDLEFFSVLNKLFENKDDHRSQRRGHHGGKEINVPRPTLNILGGTQPGYLGSLLPEEAWHMGFTSRLLMIYAAGSPGVALFEAPPDHGELRGALVRGLQAIGKLVGEFAVEPEAKGEIKLWASAGMPPVPEHARLAHYNGRRLQLMLKLCMVASASARNDLVIALPDVQRARSWLLGAEQVMPDIFRDMHMKSDQVLMTECHRFVWKLWVDSHAQPAQRKAVHRSSIMGFLALRCPAEKSFKILELMQQSDWLESVPDSLLYVPKARGLLSPE